MCLMSLTTPSARRCMTRLLASTCWLPLGLAHAQDPLALGETWRFQVTPYVWMTGLQADIRAAHSLPTAHVSQSFSDVLGNLDAAAFVNGTARKGRYVMQLDMSYAALSDTASLPLGLKARAKVKQNSLTLAGGYNWQLSPRDSVDAMLGVRRWGVKAAVNVPNMLQTQIKESFIDPIAAIRWRHQMGTNWSTLVYADAGGLGAGSELTWQLLAVVNYQIRNNIYLSGGYRHLYVDYRNSGRRLEFGMGGPVLGATFRF